VTRTRERTFRFDAVELASEDVDVRVLWFRRRVESFEVIEERCEGRRVVVIDCLEEEAASDRD